MAVAVFVSTGVNVGVIVIVAKLPDGVVEGNTADGNEEIDFEVDDVKIVLLVIDSEEKLR